MKRNILWGVSIALCLLVFPKAQAPAPVYPTRDRVISYDAAWKPAWTKTIKDTFAKFPNRVVGKILLFGDSLTYSQANGYWLLNGAPGASASDLEVSHWAHFDISSAHNGFRDAWDGRTAMSGMSWFDPIFDNALLPPQNFFLWDAQFALMMCNVPDAGNPTDVSIVEHRIDQYLALGIVPVLSTIPPRVADNPFDETIGKPYNLALYALAQRKAVPLIDLAAEFYATRPGDTWQHTLLSADGVHLSGGNDFGAGYNPGSDPYTPGGNAALEQGGDALANAGYLLRTWILLQKMWQFKTVFEAQDIQPIAPTHLQLTGVAPPPPPPDPSKEPLLQAENIVYIGGFKLPPGAGHGAPENAGFDWASRGLAFNPDGKCADGKGSLFMSAHAWYNYYSAEICPPTPSLDEANLPMATFLNDFGDLTEGHIHEIGDGGAVYAASVENGGIFVYHGKLIGSVIGVYDSTNVQRRGFYSHDIVPNKSGTFKGLFTIGNPVAQGFYSGYFGAVPPQWQSIVGGPIFSGQSGASIIFRQSLGPAATVFDPDQFGTIDPVPAISLVYYSVEHPTLGQYSGLTPPGSDFSEGVVISGAVWPVGSRSVLFYGRQGTGQSCYGSGYGLTGVTGPVLIRIEQNIEIYYYPCGGAGNGHGNGSQPYKNWIWAYDANEFAKVAKGEKIAYDIVPYAVWPIELTSDNTGNAMAGAAYDPKTQTIWLADTTSPNTMMRVYHVNLVRPIVADQEPPSAPGMVTAQAVSSSATTLTWTASTDNVKVRAYKILRDNKQLAITHDTSYYDWGLWASSTYTYAVQAVDDAGNLGPIVSAAPVTTYSVPGTPTNLVGTPMNGQVVLTWTATADDHGNLSRYYRIFRSNAPYNILGITSDTTFVDLTPVSGLQSYVVQAMDSGLHQGGDTTIMVMVP